MGSFGQDDIIVKWSEMSNLEKSKFDDDMENLIDTNKTNLLLHAIYNIVLAVLFVLLTIVLYNFDYVLPVRWVTAAKSRISFAEGINKRHFHNNFFRFFGCVFKKEC